MRPFPSCEQNKEVRRKQVEPGPLVVRHYRSTTIGENPQHYVVRFPAPRSEISENPIKGQSEVRFERYI